MPLKLAWYAGCADTVDIGETSYAMALADDLDGDGRTDLVVATMNGVVYCFEAAASRFHPLHAWPAQVPWAPGIAAHSLHFEPETPLCFKGQGSLIAAWNDKHCCIPVTRALGLA